MNEALEPLVEVGLKRGEALRAIPAVVDTGFGGYLCLAEHYADQLDMTFALAEPYELADGEVIVKDVFRGSIVFDGREQEVDVILTASRDTLIGASLLPDCRLSIDYPARIVRIERAPGAAGYARDHQREDQISREVPALRSLNLGGGCPLMGKYTVEKLPTAEERRRHARLYRNPHP